jgi:hypothetical protein
MFVMLNFWLKKVGIKHEISDKSVGILRTSIFFFRMMLLFMYLFFLLLLMPDVSLGQLACIFFFL